MTFTPDPAKLAMILEAVDIADSVIRELICDELKSRLPELEGREADAAADLRDAVEALRLPEKALSDLEAQIGKAEGETRSWDAQAHSDDISARVAAKGWFQEWNEELNTLSAKREGMERDLIPLREARDKAKSRLRQIQDDIYYTGFNSYDPAYAYLAMGTETESFEYWKLFGFFVMPLVTGQDFLHDQAMKYLEWLCVRTGFRTDHLPKESEQIRRHWDTVYDNANPAQPAPSGAEIISGFHAEMNASMRARAEQGKLDRSVTEDHRIPVPPRDYMQLQRLSGETR